MYIKEVSSRTGASPRSLRYYETRGLLHPARDRHGHRWYVERDVRVVEQILSMLAAGLDTRQIHTLLPCRLGAMTNPRLLCSAAKDVVEQRVRDVEANLETLRIQRQFLQGLLGPL